MRDVPTGALRPAPEESRKSRPLVYVACESLLCSSLGPLLLCGCFFGGSLVFAPSPGQRVGDAVIPFVARMLKYRSVDLHKRHFAFPCSFPRRGVVPRELVSDRIVADGPEAPGDFPLLRCSSK